MLTRRLSENLISPNEFPETSGSLENSKWKTHTPFEITILDRLVSLPRHIFIAMLAFYVFLSITSIIYIAISRATSSDDDDSYGMPYILALHVQAAVYLTLPIACYRFSYQVFGDSIIMAMLSHALVSEKDIFWKAILICRGNTIIVIISVITFVAQSDEKYWYWFFAVLYTTVYFIPFTSSISLCVIIVDLLRRQAMSLSTHIKGLRERREILISSSVVPSVDRQSLSQLHQRVSSDGNVDDDVEIGTGPRQPTADNETKAFSMSSHTSKCHDDIITISTDLHSLRAEYFYIHDRCKSISKSIGLYFFLFLCAGLVFAVNAVWSIYIKEVSWKSSLTFVLASVFLLLELGLSLVAANETGHLVCTHLCAFLLNDRHHYGQASSNEALILLGCIGYAKIDIPFFGNFVFRSSSMVAIVGSLVAAIIPGLVLRNN